MAGYGKRADGSQKGTGYFGEIRAKNGKSFSTELGMNADVDGEDLHFPLLHPGLSREEIDHLVNGGKPSRELVNRAIDHALKRKSEGKSPFAEDGEQMDLPESEESAVTEGFRKVRGE